MTGVLLLGDIPSTGIAGISADRVVLGTAHAPGRGGQATDASHGSNTRGDTLDAFLDLVGQRLGRGDVIVAVYPAWWPDPARRFIRFARSALETESIVGVALDLPPLALSLVADQLAYLAPYVPAGVLLGLAPRLAQDTLAGAWVGSVARLEHVSASLGHHLRSYLPGGFMVTACPEQAVHRITSGTPVGELFFRPADPVQVLAVREDGDARWFQQRLLPHVRPARVQFFQPQPFSGTYWGTRKYVEYVAFSSHPQALSYAAGSVRVRRCRWCEQVVATSTCPFCGMTRHRSGQRRPGQQVGAPRPAASALRPTTTPNPVDGVPSGLASGSAESSDLTPPAGPADQAGPLPSPTEPGSGVP